MEFEKDFSHWLAQWIDKNHEAPRSIDTARWAFKYLDRIHLKKRWALQQERDRLCVELAKLRGALEFYANDDNRSACLIDQYEFVEKYFKRDYIVDVIECEFVKDNGLMAKQALETGGDE